MKLVPITLFDKLTNPHFKLFKFFHNSYKFVQVPLWRPSFLRILTPKHLLHGKPLSADHVVLKRQFKFKGAMNRPLPAYAPLQ